MENFNIVDRNAVPVNASFQIIDPKTEFDPRTTMVDLVLRFNNLYSLGKKQNWEKMYDIKNLFTAIVGAIFSIYGPPLGYEWTREGLREFMGDLSQTKHSMDKKSGDTKIIKSSKKTEKRFYKSKYSTQRCINFNY